MTTPPEAIALIVDAEGIDQPGQWPGGESGITLGVGYDLGYETPEAFASDWGPHLDAEQIARLKLALGDTGDCARRLAPEFSDIHISRAAASEVFARVTLPKYEMQTSRAFPGVELLPAQVFGALVSIVFNRGPGMDGDRRREMCAIRDSIHGWAALSPSARASSQRALLLTIAAQIRSMKRLWVGQGLDGLLSRRENEAKLVEQAATAPVTA